MAKSAQYPTGIKTQGVTVESEGVIMDSVVKGIVNNQVAVPAAYFNRGEEQGVEQRQKTMKHL